MSSTYLVPFSPLAGETTPQASEGDVTHPARDSRHPYRFGGGTGVSYVHD